eukprot:CAMPEP_0185258596 /NCGR_PEP_ID=MMETSP1359-20130426/7497_1 /TAXON_ID=552665 /ORGANISM="Bigelowiella longifila, Strain CCMP242" /LENGTH=277 /DNA_ID=CAMNT_0027844153 /DNA_START=1 /DNA_END=834 /DNA_ORIENTATION=+
MDPSFIGLIFSVFNEGQQQQRQHNGGGDKLEIIAFQSVDCNKESPLESEIRQRHHQRGYSHEYRQIPMEILPPAQIFGVNKKAVISSRQHMRETLRHLVALAAQEEHETYRKYSQNTCQSNKSHIQNPFRVHMSQLEKRTAGYKRQRIESSVDPANDHKDDDDDGDDAGSRGTSSSCGNLKKEDSGTKKECKRGNRTRKEPEGEEWRIDEEGWNKAGTKLKITKKKENQPLCGNRLSIEDIYNSSVCAKRCALKDQKQNDTACHHLHIRPFVHHRIV